MAQLNSSDEKKISPLPGMLLQCAVVCERCFASAGRDARWFKECADICRETAEMLTESYFVFPVMLDACAHRCTECSVECQYMSVSEQYMACTMACMNCAVACREQVLAIMN